MLSLSCLPVGPDTPQPGPGSFGGLSVNEIREMKLRPGEVPFPGDGAD